VVVSNGTQTDPISEKVAAGMPIRDALALSLLTLDYEKDEYNTPRIAAAVPLVGNSGWLGTVRRDALVLTEISLEAGRASYVATYEMDDPRQGQSLALDAADAAEVARFLVDGGEFAKLTHAVTSAAAVASGHSFELATLVV
jgi:IMP cyclohydrolase